MPAQDSDPRRPDRLRPIKRSADVDDLPPDLYAIGALGMGLVGMLTRNKLASWLAAGCCLGMLSNLRPAETDAKQILCSVMVSIMALVVNYLHSQ